MKRGSRLSGVTNRHRHNVQVKKILQEEKRQRSRVRRDTARRRQAPSSTKTRKEPKVSDKYTYIPPTRKEKDIIDIIFEIPEWILNTLWDMIFAILPPYKK